MSHEIHARVLLMAIEEIDKHIVESVDDGSVPLIDAVEMVRLLRALVAAAPEYIVDRERARRRFARLRLSEQNPVVRTHAFVVGTQWGVPDQEAES